jgi:hypothetical protein
MRHLLVVQSFLGAQLQMQRIPLLQASLPAPYAACLGVFAAVRLHSGCVLVGQLGSF